MQPIQRAPEPVPPPAPKSFASIGKAVTIKGEIYSEEDLFIDGRVEGLLELKEHKLTVGPNGRADTNITAREVVVQGTVHGNIDAQQKITIRKDGNVVGNIKTTGIIIEDDAYFKGSIDIVMKNGK
ncbi:MAG: polymer-forming cytoskeletal protein [Bryobacteraceae bacterium]